MLRPPPKSATCFANQPSETVLCRCGGSCNLFQKLPRAWEYLNATTKIGAFGFADYPDAETASHAGNMTKRLTVGCKSVLKRSPDIALIGTMNQLRCCCHATGTFFLYQGNRMKLLKLLWKCMIAESQDHLLGMRATCGRDCEVVACHVERAMGERAMGRSREKV